MKVNTMENKLSQYTKISDEVLNLDIESKLKPVTIGDLILSIRNNYGYDEGAILNMPLAIYQSKDGFLSMLNRQDIKEVPVLVYKDNIKSELIPIRDFGFNGLPSPSFEDLKPSIVIEL